MKFARKNLPILFLLLLGPLALLLNALSAGNPRITEEVYCRGIYPVLSRYLSALPGLAPFCVAELLLFCLAALLLFLIVLAAVRLRRLTLQKAGRAVLFTAGILSTVYFLFIVLWGLNYNRQTLMTNLRYKDGTVTKQELSAVFQRETGAVNQLCSSVSFDPQKHSYYPGGLPAMSRQVNDGYVKLAKQNSLFNKNTPHPKGVLLSVPLSYTGTDGIFIPFTYEPCVNTLCPEFMLASNMAHESAHFKGFAREDEANFVAYLANLQNSAPYFRYSAHMLAYLYISNALYQTDQNLWNSLASWLDARAQADLQSYNDYANRYSGPVEQASQKINDSYLKAQGQPGIISYNLFVNLLCAQYRTNQK